MKIINSQSLNQGSIQNPHKVTDYGGRLKKPGRCKSRNVVNIITTNKRT